MQPRTFAGLMLGATLLTTLVIAQGPGPASDFKPDTVFAGSGLGAWTVVGDGAWTAEKGEVRGKAGQGGSWLVLDRSYQDLNFFSRFRCSSPCDAGVLFRVQATGSGRTGILLSLKDGDLATYRVTLDAAGRALSRDRLRPVGPFVRSAPPATSDAARAIPAAGAGLGGSPMTLPTPLSRSALEWPPPPRVPSRTSAEPRSNAITSAARAGE